MQKKLCYTIFHKMFVGGKESVTDQTIILSGKYQLLRPLGSGTSATVFLARHLTLNCERAIKVSPKTSPVPNSIFAEATLLTELRHPGIPQIFDIEEDESNYYLIEEYVDGISVKDLLLRQPTISLTEFNDIATQLCEIFIYLHGLAPQPILYQDLKPEHVLIRDGKLILIDFSIPSCFGEIVSEVYGNYGFSAPEVIAQNTPSVQSDIFTIGKFLLFLANRVSDRNLRNLIPILKKATNMVPDLRYETVEEFRNELVQMQSLSAPLASCKQIAVIGSFHGCGTTHIALALSATFCRLGYPALYFENNSGDVLRKSAQAGISFKRQDGLYFYKHFAGMPLYGPGISVEPPGGRLSIIDCGISPQPKLLNSSELIVLIADGSPWRIQECIAMNEILSPFSSHLCIISNYGNRRNARNLARKLSVPVFTYPMDYNPFEVTREKMRLCKKLLTQ